MKQEVYVWDILVRVFHWSLVLFFLLAYLSGDEWDDLHIYSGYIILALLVTRIVWGFIGSRYARFSGFVTSPEKMLSYLKDLLSGKPEHYVGHNPAGGWMILALLLSLSLTGLTGYALEQGYQLMDMGIPVVVEQLVDDDEEELLEEVHEFFAGLSLFLIGVHVLGVLVSSRVHKENLIKAMITGYKQ
ncbi:MAG: cytochrome B [Gammaproteobacteria bacterium]|nr:cytochrome B [Gammaproteobacteria bacterium]